MTQARTIILSATAVLSIAGASFGDTGLDAIKPVKEAESRLAKTQARLAANNPLAIDVQSASQYVTKAYQRVEQVHRDIAIIVAEKPEAHQIDLQIRDLTDQLALAKTVEHRADIAAQILQVRSRRTAMMRDALEGSIPLTIAQADLQEAMNNLRFAEAQLLQSINDNPETVNARSQLTTARKSMPTIVYAYGG